MGKRYIRKVGPKPGTFGSTQNPEAISEVTPGTLMVGPKTRNLTQWWDLRHGIQDLKGGIQNLRPLLFMGQRPKTLKLEHKTWDTRSWALVICGV